MSPWVQHAIVIGLAVACAVVIIVRRVRALSGRAPACDGCAQNGEQKPIPKEALLRHPRR